MIDKSALCEKIREIYPDVGHCGIDIDTEYDHYQQRWVVRLKKDQRELKTYLENGDAEMCLGGDQCISLGIEIAQLKDNLAQL